MVGEYVEAEEFCWNIGYGWVAEEEEGKSAEKAFEDIIEFPETILPTLPLPVGEEQGIEANLIDLNLDMLNKIEQTPLTEEN